MDDLNGLVDTLGENYDEFTVDVTVNPEQPAEQEDAGSVRILEGNTNGDNYLWSGTQGDNNLLTSGDLEVASPDEVNPDVSNMFGGTGNSTTITDVASNSGNPGVISGDGNTAPVAANTGDPGVISGSDNTAPFMGNAGDNNSVPFLSNEGQQDIPIASNTGESNPTLFTLDPVNNGDKIQNLSDLIHEPNLNVTNSTDFPIHLELAGGSTGGSLLGGLTDTLGGLLGGGGSGGGLLSSLAGLLGGGSGGGLLSTITSLLGGGGLLSTITGLLGGGSGGGLLSGITDALGGLFGGGGN